jgi:isopentenyl diphosphate isomerase/L-lactate dehydrogenase-like FMN-dependent dehydrogenase
VRGGSDIIKALALGAHCVLVGRPYIWGLAAAGEAGVKEVLHRLLAEFDLNCALCGVSQTSEIDRGLIRQAVRFGL